MGAGEEVTGAVAPIVSDVGTVVVGQLKDPGVVSELGLSVMLLVVVIIAHGWLLGHVSRFFGSGFSKLKPTSPHWRTSLLMGSTIAMLALTHLLQTLIWAIPMWSIGVIPEKRDAYYFVLGSYTTLGAGDVVMPEDWRLIGPVIAISGFFTFSWTGSVLVYVMTEIGRRHQKHAERNAQAVQADGDSDADAI